MIAHIAGVPLEEMAPSLVGAGASLLVARAWLSQRLRRWDRMEEERQIPE